MGIILLLAGRTTVDDVNNVWNRVAGGIINQFSDEFLTRLSDLRFTGLRIPLKIAWRSQILTFKLRIRGDEVVEVINGDQEEGEDLEDLDINRRIQQLNEATTKGSK